MALQGEQEPIAIATTLELEMIQKKLVQLDPLPMHYFLTLINKSGAKKP